MEASEAIAIIDAIADSLRSDPSQFQLEVRVETTGMKVEQRGPGVGLMSVATGPGSIGTHVTARGGSVGGVSMQRKAADEDVRAKVEQAVGLLDDIRAELHKASPDRTTIDKIIERLGKTIVSPAIIAAVSAAVRIMLTGQL